jgi:hypothetical protein
VADEPIAPPEGPVRYAWFGGLLDGRRRDDARLEQAVARGNRLGLARMDLDVDGGKFSVLFDDNAVAGEVMTAEKADQLLEVLNDVLASAEPATVESTLRCTEVYDDAAVDTLFTPNRDKIECVSRSRAIAAEDRSHAPPAAEPLIQLPRMGRRQALGLLALVLVAFGLLAWQVGLVDRIAGRSGEALEIDPGPFGDVLAVEVVSRWGNYRVTLRRGTGWPGDAAAAQARIDAAVSNEEGAAMRAVADGRDIWVHVRDAEGEVLEARELGLARLLRDGTEDRAVVVVLPGRISARTVTLGLDSGRADG